MVSLTFSTVLMATIALLATQVRSAREIDIYTDESGKTVTATEFPYGALGCSGDCDFVYMLPASHLANMRDGQPTPVGGGETPPNYTGPKPSRWNHLTPIRTTVDDIATFQAVQTTVGISTTPPPMRTTVDVKVTSTPAPSLSNLNGGDRAAVSIACALGAVLAAVAY